MKKKELHRLMGPGRGCGTTKGTRPAGPVVNNARSRRQSQADGLNSGESGNTLSE